jgi:CubicO group peptidase (beta-lactamase class C family)
MPAAHCCWLATAPDILRVLGLLATDGVHEGQRVLPPGWVGEMMHASRVNPDGGLQLKLITIGGVPAISGDDDDGNTFWVFPARQLVIISVVNPAGSNSLELPAQLLRILGADQ